MDHPLPLSSCAGANAISPTVFIKSNTGFIKFLKIQLISSLIIFIAISKIFFISSNIDILNSPYCLFLFCFLFTF